MIFFYYCKYFKYLIFRTAIESDGGALKSAVLNFVFFIILKNKIEQFAKRRLLLNFWYKKYDHIFDET
ncbi:MAG TPA: hypothetical protein DHV15_05180 [Treponema sp.]|uniref:Uncharacterized protein n=1 Tax=Treponema denticola (strain ATCC 35405 / DSM 14222 / CIP 103919 / JCM 8153 / KCTC 15104) TaxID=243275 RepID=Q73ME0_TREDE|nr:hypothetical protein TDE_1568 [Treponema denticola ATCC 35405]HCY94893.1 hypothetical protein [Treponema sp.]